MNSALILMVALIFQQLSACAQTYHAAESEIIVKGRSGDRSWKMVSQKSRCRAEVEFRGGKLVKIRSVEFSMPVKELKGENDLMNKRAYKALKAYPYSNIAYTGKLFSVTGGGNMYLVKTEGNLQIAGVTQAVSMPVTMVVNKNPESITCLATKTIKMSDFHVIMPEVLVKNMNIGDQVTIDLKLLLTAGDSVQEQPRPSQREEDQ